jgi:hypothetical protein
VNTPAQAGVGDIGPGGGVIFYKDAAGFKQYESASDLVGKTVYYLELAPQSTYSGNSYAWSSVTAPASEEIFGTVDTIGTGRRNTLRILEKDSAAPAAITSRDFKTTVNHGADTYLKTVTYGDWFLPSKSELDELYKAYAKDKTDAKTAAEADPPVPYELKFKDLAEFSYWSSTEMNKTTAKAVDLHNSGQTLYELKSTKFRIRPIRAF